MCQVLSSLLVYQHIKTNTPSGISKFILVIYIVYAMYYNFPSFGIQQKKDYSLLRENY